MREEWYDRFLSICELLGEVPTDVLVRKARALFPALVDDPEQRANFRDHFRFVAMCRRSGMTLDRRVAEEIADGVNALRDTSYHITVDDTVVGSRGPMSDLPPKTTEDVLSESAVELKAAEAAEALAAAFEEGARRWPT
jgi:hypothetical protein